LAESAVESIVDHLLRESEPGGRIAVNNQVGGKAPVLLVATDVG
jgi:hypothetical protein